MNILKYTIGLMLCWGSSVFAQTTYYQIEFLGSGYPIKINNIGQVIGQNDVNGATRGFVSGHGMPVEYLPIPPGMNSSHAMDINENGVIVGAVSEYSSPEFFGHAAVWVPENLSLSDSMEYSVYLLDELSGSVTSRAVALNNIGDIVGYCSDGTYRYPTLFSLSDKAIDLSPAGVFDPADVNDQRIVADHSFTVKRLDLNTMIAEDLGVPAGNYLATTASAINENNQVGGLAILTSGGSCDRVAARYTDGVGWETFGSCGRYNGVSDMNDRGDLVMRLNIDSYVYFQDSGSFRIADLIVSDDGPWYVINHLGVSINNARWITAFATNPNTGQGGTVLLTPILSDKSHGPLSSLSTR